MDKMRFLKVLSIKMGVFMDKIEFFPIDAGSRGGSSKGQRGSRCGEDEGGGSKGQQRQRDSRCGEDEGGGSAEGGGSEGGGTGGGKSGGDSEGWRERE